MRIVCFLNITFAVKRGSRNALKGVGADKIQEDMKSYKLPYASLSLMFSVMENTNCYKSDPKGFAGHADQYNQLFLQGFLQAYQYSESQLNLHKDGENAIKPLFDSVVSNLGELQEFVNNCTYNAIMSFANGLIMGQIYYSAENMTKERKLLYENMASMRNEDVDSVKTLFYQCPELDQSYFLGHMLAIFYHKGIIDINDILVCYLFDIYIANSGKNCHRIKRSHEDCLTMFKLGLGVGQEYRKNNDDSIPEDFSNTVSNIRDFFENASEERGITDIVTMIYSSDDILVKKHQQDKYIYNYYKKTLICPDSTDENTVSLVLRFLQNKNAIKSFLSNPPKFDTVLDSYHTLSIDYNSEHSIHGLFRMNEVIGKYVDSYI